MLTCTMTTDERNLELTALAVAGDEAALERLLLRYHGRLTHQLASKIPSGMRALITVEDVLQEAYLTVFQKIGGFQQRGPGSFYRWLATIAENRLIDAIKAERAAKRGGGRRRVDDFTNPMTGSTVEWLEMLAVHERTPSRSAAGREAMAHVSEALKSLKDDYREALQLRYIEGLPVNETAARMKRTEGAVCLLCHRGLKRLSHVLGQSTRFFSTGE
ncbi:MAG: sigma-70 family RNA polymerase sigma factor [Planctomycetota bacterium]